VTSKRKAACGKDDWEQSSLLYRHGGAGLAPGATGFGLTDSQEKQIPYSLSHYY
jgi:hypothetical protein